MFERHTTPAQAGTWEAAREKTFRPALVAAGFIAIAAFTLLGMFAPQVFTVPWDDGFSKVRGGAEREKHYHTRTLWCAP